MRNSQRVTDGCTYVRGAVTSVTPIAIKQTVKPVPTGLKPRIVTAPRTQNAKH